MDLFADALKAGLERLDNLTDEEVSAAFDDLPDPNPTRARPFILGDEPERI